MKIKIIKGFFAEHVRIAALGLKENEICEIHGQRYRYGKERNLDGRVIAHYLEPIS